MSDPYSHYIPTSQVDQLYVDTQRKLHQQKVEKERAWQKQQADLMKPNREAHSPLHHTAGRAAGVRGERRGQQTATARCEDAARRDRKRRHTRAGLFVFFLAFAVAAIIGG